MRHVREKDLARSGSNMPVRKRVFLAFEGFKTEVDYFSELLDQSDSLGLNERIEVIILNRYKTDSGFSDPLSVLKMCADHMRFLADGVCSVDMFERIVTDAVGRENIGLVKGMLSDPEFDGMVDGDDIGDHLKAAEFACRYMSAHGIEVGVSFDRHLYIRDEDDVYIVVDRDARDRPKENHEEFIDGCHEHGFKPVVTNPRFELWILMHLDDATEDLASIATDKNPSSKLTKCMRCRGLDKKHPNMEHIVPRLDTAMRNAEPYIHTPEELESTVGTNVPDLIENMRVAQK